MSKVGSMTIGLVLIFLGAQLYLVKSYLLTPTATQFVSDYFNSNNGSQFAGPNSGPGLLSNGNSQQLGGSQSNGAFSTAGFSGNQPAAGNSFGVGSNAGAQIARYPGQSWPYHGSGAGNAAQSNAGGNGGMVQNSSFGSSAPQSFSASNQIALDGQMRRRFMPPKWIMWPALFMGGVCFLHGLALKS